MVGRSVGQKKEKNESLKGSGFQRRPGCKVRKPGYKVNSKTQWKTAIYNSCALVIRIRKGKRAVALPMLKFVDKNLSFQEVFTDVYDGDLDVRVKCRVGFKKPGDAEPKDFVSVDLAANVRTIVNALGVNFVVAPIMGLKLSNKTV